MLGLTNRQRFVAIFVLLWALDSFIDVPIDLSPGDKVTFHDLDKLISNGKIERIDCHQIGARSSVEAIVVESNGPSKGTVIFLPGFPDAAISFYRNVPAFHAENYNVILPVLRGYDGRNINDNSTSAKNFLVSQVAKDLKCIVDNVKSKGQQNVHAVGHDWGSSVVDAFDYYYGSELASITLIAVPQNFALGLLFLPSQLIKSWYMIFFQIPFVSKLFVTHFGVDWAWSHWSPTYTPDPVFLESLHQVFRQPGVVSNSISFYRQNIGAGVLKLLLVAFGFFILPFAFVANLRQRRFKLILFFSFEVALLLFLCLTVYSNDPTVSTFFGDDATKTRDYFFSSRQSGSGAPVLAITGKDDGCIQTSMFDFMQGSSDRFKLLRINGGHFVHQESPKEVNQAILQWITLHARN